MRKGYLHHMVSRDRFRLVQGEEALATYQFGTGRALHHFCRYCGVASFYRPRANPANYMINARCLEGVDLDSLERVRFGTFSRRASPSSELPQPELARLTKTIPITALTFCGSGISG